MSLKISEVGGYGSGTLGEVTEVSNVINSYARVTALGEKTATIILQAAFTGNYGGFEVGKEVLFHVSGSTGANYHTYLGAWTVANITAVSGDVLTLDKNLTSILPADQISHYYCQLVTIPHFKSLTIEKGVQLQPITYSATNYYGGIVAFKCSDTLTFNGGHINLNDVGIPPASKALRPVMTLENNATVDTAQYSGWENFSTKEHFTLQAGDGAAFIVAKNFVCHEDSRIGNINSYGSQFCRGAADSVGTKPANITNVGGSSIFIVADSIENFTPKILSKYRASTSAAGQGICRCYIATNTTLRNDEGLYSFDNISNPTRIMKNFNVRDFGNGSIGDVTNSLAQLNNYARVTAINDSRKKISYLGKTTIGLAQIITGALVMIHCNHKDSMNVEYSGKFILAKVLSDNGSDLTLNYPVPPEFDIEKYTVQIVSVAQVNNYTLSSANTATPKFDGKIGGILALAVKGTCNLTGGQLNVEGKGGGAAYGAAGLQYISNSGMCDRLPIGQGHGSVFLLAKTLTMNANTRIGASYSGAAFGGQGGANSEWRAGAGGGYKGSPASDTRATLRGLIYGAGDGRYDGFQGAHIMIIADTINDFFVNAVSTGGTGGASGNGAFVMSRPGGAGYGGGSGADKVIGGCGGGFGCGAIGGFRLNTNWRVGSGGSSGWAYIFCNNAVNPTYTNVIV